MSNLGKLPAIQWYPGDWKKDSGVQSLDYYDRGVWWELLQIMHCSDRRGVLVWSTGMVMDDDAIAQLLGIDLEKWKQVRSRLLSRGVASVEQKTGALFNRRMLRDEELRKDAARRGALGGKQKAINGLSKSLAKARSSSSSSTSVGGTAPPTAASRTEADLKQESAAAQRETERPQLPADPAEQAIIDAVHRWDPTFPTDQITKQIHRAAALGVGGAQLLQDVKAKGDRLRIWTIVDGYQYDKPKNGSNGKIRENAPTEKAPCLQERRDVVQARQDEERARQAHYLASLSTPERARWEADARELAKQNKVPEKLVGMFVEDQLRIWARQELEKLAVPK
jgi:hypothetical protein